MDLMYYFNKNIIIRSISMFLYVLILYVPCHCFEWECMSFLTYFVNFYLFCVLVVFL